MQPGHKNMCMNVSGVGQLRHGVVIHVFLEKFGSFGFDVNGRLTDKIVQHGNIMRSKRPKYIFFCPHRSQIQSGGLQVVKLSDFARINHFFDFLNSRMEKKYVTNHQLSVVFFSDFYKFLRGPGRQSHRFFNQYVFSFLK